MFGQYESIMVTAVQHAPVYLNLQQSIYKATQLIQEAALGGAKLVVFPETWLPGYPVWLDVAKGAGLWEYEPATAVYRHLFQNSPTLHSTEINTLCQSAKMNQVMVVMGMNERKGGTLYNTILTISAEGEILGVHRKLMPTYTERLVWGQGHEEILPVYDTPLGRVGGLICWEHWMPLARYAMHQKQELIHIAQWPTVKEMHRVASRHYAFEGRCFVVAVGTVLQKKDLAHLDLALFAEIEGDDEMFLMRGGSTIIDPFGHCLTDPVFDKPALVSATLDVAKAIDGRLTLDTTGHYDRPDIFQLHIKGEAGKITS